MNKPAIFLTFFYSILFSANLNVNQNNTKRKLKKFPYLQQ